MTPESISSSLAAYRPCSQNRAQTGDFGWRDRSSGVVDVEANFATA
jgi:hypothetical protein